MKIADIARVIEGVLFVSGDGVDRDEFKRIYDLSDKELNKCLDILKAKYTDEGGIHIISYKNKLQLCSNPALADSIAEILNPIRERSLTKAALETIAIVAYKQPITRTEIEQIRGVNCDYAVQLLQSNNLIEVVGRKDAVGKPLLFGTTDNFLKRFELSSLEDLPNYKELLDRIRVIHSEGDSLYREFTIPEEENSGEENATGEEGVNNLEVENQTDTKQGLVADEQPEKQQETSTIKTSESETVSEEQTSKTKPKKNTKSKKESLESAETKVVEIENAKQGSLVENNVLEESKSNDGLEEVKLNEIIDAKEISLDGVKQAEIDNNTIEEKPSKSKAKRRGLIEHIADVDEENEASSVSEDKSIANTSTKQIDTITNNSENTVTIKPKKVEIENSIEPEQATATSEPVEDKPKMSWRDKMRAKMDANSHHYENLHEFIKS